MECRLCGSNNMKLHYTQGNNDEYKFYLCDDCGLVNYDLSGGLNQEKYAEVYNDPFDIDSQINTAQKISFDYFSKYAQNSGVFLEIGCGNGYLLSLAQNFGHEVQGLELSGFLAKSIKETLGIDVKVDNFLSDNDLFDKKFDYVILRHVLEHLPDSVFALNKINNLLKPGGIALLEFPNINAFKFKTQRLKQKIGLSKKKYKKKFVPGHCNEFSRKSFKYLSEKTGFEILSRQTYSYKPVNNMIYSIFPLGNKTRVVIRKPLD